MLVPETLSFFEFRPLTKAEQDLAHEAQRRSASPVELGFDQYKVDYATDWENKFTVAIVFNDVYKLFQLGVAKRITYANQGDAPNAITGCNIALSRAFQSEFNKFGFGNE